MIPGGRRRNDDSRLGPNSRALSFDEDSEFEPEGSDEVFAAARLQSTWNTSFAN